MPRKKSTTAKPNIAKGAAKPSASTRGGKKPKTPAQRPSAHPSSDHPLQYVIQGTVKQSNGAPLTGVTVRAFDWDIGGENLLGALVSSLKCDNSD